MKVSNGHTFLSSKVYQNNKHHYKLDPHSKVGTTINKVKISKKHSDMNPTKD